MDTKASQVVTQLREVIDQNHSATCDALFRTACESMTILEPWLHATSKNPVAMNVIEAVQKIIPDFVDSLKGSIDVAKQGFKISGDMIYLCDHLLDLDGTRHQEVEEYVSELKSSATEAETGSKQVATTFRMVRRRLLMITDDIPGQVARIEEDRQRQVKKNENSLKHIEKAKFVKACCTGIAAIAGGVTLITCPPALIILPIALPLICLMTEAFETRALKKITERETREQDCREAQKTLEKVTMDLVQLAECVDRFASFWRTLELLLETVSGRVRELRKSRSFRLRLKNIKSSLEEIARSFEEYSVKVGHLCEFMALKAESTGTRKLDRIEERATRSQKSERMIKT